MMRVILVDDEPLALDRLAFAFRDIAEVEVIGTAANGEAAAALIAAEKPDLVILDIQMPGRTGLAVAADLVDADRPEVVFVTAYEQFAPDAFDVEAIDYLIKPVRFDRLRQAVERARRRRRERHAAALLEAAPPAPVRGETIVVPDPRGNRHVAVETIQWVEAAKDYVLLHTPERSVMMRSTMAAVEEQLRAPDFLRIHRSAIVGLRAVDRHRRTERGSLVIVLKDGFELSVGAELCARRAGAAHPDRRVSLGLPSAAVVVNPAREQQRWSIHAAAPETDLGMAVVDPRPDWRPWAGLAAGLVAGIALIAFTGLYNAEPLLRWLGVAGTHGRSAVFAVIFGMSALLLLTAGAVVLGLHDGAAGQAGVSLAVRNVLLVIVGALCGWALALLYTPFGSEDAARLHSISQALTVFASGYLLSKLDRLLERALFGADGTPGRGWIYALLFAGALLAALLMTFSARQYGSGEDDAPGGASFAAAPGTVVLESGRRIEVGADGRLRVAGIDYGPIVPAARVALAGAGGAVLVDGVVRAPVPAKPTPPSPAPKPTSQVTK